MLALEDDGLLGGGSLEGEEVVGNVVAPEPLVDLGHRVALTGTNADPGSDGLGEMRRRRGRQTGIRRKSGRRRKEEREREGGKEGERRDLGVGLNLAHEGAEEAALLLGLEAKGDGAGARPVLHLLEVLGGHAELLEDLEDVRRMRVKMRMEKRRMMRRRRAYGEGRGDGGLGEVVGQGVLVVVGMGDLAHVGKASRRGKQGADAATHRLPTT